MVREKRGHFGFEVVVVYSELALRYRGVKVLFSSVKIWALN